MTALATRIVEAIGTAEYGPSGSPLRMRARGRRFVRPVDARRYRDAADARRVPRPTRLTIAVAVAVAIAALMSSADVRSAPSWLVRPIATKAFSADSRGHEAAVSAERADTLSLNRCYAAARAHFPLTRHKSLYEELGDLQETNTAARLLPSLSASGQVIYQSDVPELPFQMPGIAAPEVARDQYRAALNVEQIFYDGGVTAALQAAERAAIGVEAQQVEADFHERKERINEAYFAVLLQQAAQESLTSLREEIQARRHALLAQVEQGLLPAARLDVLEVEMLNVDQQLSDAEAGRRASIAVLATLTGLELDETTRLTVPDPETELGTGQEMAPSLDADGRPEHRVFESTRAELERQQVVAGRRNRPSVAGFATAAYGRPPGMDIFENALSPYFSLGLSVKWAVWDWGRARRDRQMLALRQALVDAREATFEQGIRAAAERERREIARLMELLASDREIIRIRKRIAQRAGGELENGVISATDYVVQQHAEQQARYAHDRHRIELAFARVRFLTILGRTDEIR